MTFAIISSKKSRKNFEKKNKYKITNYCKTKERTFK